MRSFDSVERTRSLKDSNSVPIVSDRICSSDHSSRPSLVTSGYTADTHEHSSNCLKSRDRTEELAGEPMAETGGPDDATDNDQRSRRIQSALMTIKTEYRSVIILKHFLEFNYVEIGEILDIPEQKVKSRLYSGRQLLKDALKESRLS